MILFFRILNDGYLYFMKKKFNGFINTKKIATRKGYPLYLKKEVENVYQNTH